MNSRIEADQLLEVSVWSIAARLTRRAKLVASSAILGGSLAAGVALLRPKYYTSEVILQPQASAQAMAQLSTLAAQLGVRVPGADGTESPDLYRELLTSRPVLDAVASAQFTADGTARDLSYWADIEARDEKLRRELVVEWILDDVISTSTDKVTGLVRFAIRTKDPILTQQVATTFLQQLETFNQQTRQSRASSERRFIDQRLESSRGELEIAESKLRTFIRSNRRLDDSPDLKFEYEKLQRDVSLRQQIVVTLAEALQQARIAEVRDTPVITVIQPPRVPAKHDRKHAFAWLAGGLLLGFASAAAAVLTMGSAPPTDEASRRDYEEVVANMRRMLPWRRVDSPDRAGQL